jgi:hypothetical protein
VIKGDDVSLFYIASLQASILLQRIEPRSKENVLVCIDCVLGLPHQLGISWREALGLFANVSEYGRVAASKYFRKIGNGKIYYREFEAEIGAHSVFKETPFQRNIQTGTYRIWKDLSQNQTGFYVPAIEQASHEAQIPLFEGYPSFSWKLLFDQRTRRPKDLREILRQTEFGLNWTDGHQDATNKDPNLADAFVLALTMREYRHDAFNRTPHTEGWILGWKSGDRGHGPLIDAHITGGAR